MVYFPYPAWYWPVWREAMNRAHWLCEEPGCGRKAMQCHHRHYPQDRREEPRDLEALCWEHHRKRHDFLYPANDEEDAEQFELLLDACDGKVKKPTLH
jgi:hypothetical protein